MNTTQRPQAKSFHGNNRLRQQKLDSTTESRLRRQIISLSKILPASQSVAPNGG